MSEKPKLGWVTPNVYIGPDTTDKELMALALAIFEDLQEKAANAPPPDAD